MQVQKVKMLQKRSPLHQQSPCTRQDSSGRVMNDTETSIPGNTQYSHQTSTPLVIFQPTIPASERPQTQPLDQAATRTGTLQYTGCNRRNVRDFGRVFLMSNYTDITQNTYIQSWTVTEIMAIEMCGLLGCRRTVRRPWRHTCPMRARQQDMVIQSAHGSSDVTR